MKIIKLLLLVFTLSNSFHAFAAQQDNPTAKPLRTKTRTTQRRLLAVDSKDDDDDDEANEHVKERNSTESGIDKSAFAIEVDTDDPQGVYLPLKKLKMMAPGPGVKQRPKKTLVKTKKKSDQPVKRRRKRREAFGQEKIQLSRRPLHYMKDMSDVNYNRRSLFNKRRGKTKSVTFKSTKYRSKDNSKLIDNSKKDAKMIDYLRAKREAERLRPGARLDETTAGKGKQKTYRDRMSAEKEEDTFPQSGHRNDHRTKEWLKKELNSIETLMNATKHRMGKKSSRGKAAISPQLEEDLQKIDQDIHGDLKHVSSGKQKSVDDKDPEISIHVTHGRGGHESGRFGNARNRPRDNHQNVVNVQPRYRQLKSYDNGEASTNSFLRDLNKNSFPADNPRHRGRFSDSDQATGRRMPHMADFSRMLDELEWVKHETDVVRSKTRKIEAELRIRQRDMIGGDDTYRSDRREEFPEEHNIHVSIRHGNKGGNGRLGDYFHRHAVENPRPYYREKSRQDREGIERDRFRDRILPIQPHDTQNSKSNNDKNLLNTFNRLQHDLKVLKMKMDARDKLDGAYSYPLQEERIPVAPPIFDKKYFQGGVAKDESKEIMLNSSLDSEDDDDVMDLERKATNIRRGNHRIGNQEEDNVEDQNDDLNEAGSGLMSNRNNFRRFSRIKRSLANQDISNLRDFIDNCCRTQLIGCINKHSNIANDLNKLIRLKSKQFVFRNFKRFDSGKYWWLRKRIINLTLRHRVLSRLLSRNKITLLKGSILRWVCKSIFRETHRLSTMMFKLCAKVGNIVKNNVGVKRFNSNLSTNKHQMNTAKARETENKRLRHNEVDAKIKSNLNQNILTVSNQVTFKIPNDENNVTQKNIIKMKIVIVAPNYEDKRKHRSHDGGGMALKETSFRVKLRRVRRKAVRNREVISKEPASKLEKSLAKQFEQLLELLPESEEEKHSELNLLKDDLKQERAFDLGESVRKIDKEESADIDFLKESMEANYLLAGSRIRRNVLDGIANKLASKGNGVNTLMKVSTFEKPKKASTLTHGVVRKRSVNAFPKANLTSTGPSNAIDDGTEINGHERLNPTHRNGDILNKDILHMMDFYEGKGDDFNPQTEGDVKRRKRASKKAKSQSKGKGNSNNAWLFPSVREYPHEARANYFPEYDTSEPSEPNFFPNAYSDLSNARDRLRWYALLDGENKLANEIEFLNNMADRLIEEETDPMLLLLDEMKIPKESNDYTSWSQLRESDLPQKRDPTVLQDAIDDFNNNENERNAAFSRFSRKKRQVISDQHKPGPINNVDNAVTDTNEVDGQIENLGDTESVGSDYDYQFDESQIEELDDEESDNDDDSDDDYGNVKEDGGGSQPTEDKRDGEGENIYDDDDDDDDDDDEDADDDLSEEDENGIEVDDNGRKIESDEPFAYIEREISTKKKAIRQEEYFWGPWSSCSLTCGIGQRFRSNMCSQGQPCAGKQASTETEICADDLEC